jgi:hypothetical protein
MNCFSKKLIDNIGDIDCKFSELFNRIKLFLETYSNDDSKIKSNLIIFNKLYLLYFKGGIIVNGNILITNIKSLINLYENNDICVIKSCVNETIFDGMIMSKKENSILLEIINIFLDNPHTTNINKLLLDAVNTKPNCNVLNENIILDK